MFSAVTSGPLIITALVLAMQLLPAAGVVRAAEPYEIDVEYPLTGERILALLTQAPGHEAAVFASSPSSWSRYPRCATPTGDRPRASRGKS